MKQHKWHKEIKAWADGAEIEYRIRKPNEPWSDWDLVIEPTWHLNTWQEIEYRIKPQPKEMNPEPNEEFTWWYERVFLQSPSMCELKYDDEKMWQAWIAGYKLGRDNAYKRKDIPIETFTILKRENKEPQYYYVWQNHKGEVLFHLDDNRIKETPMEYKCIGKIKLEE